MFLNEDALDDHKESNRRPTSSRQSTRSANSGGGSLPGANEENDDNFGSASLPSQNRAKLLQQQKELQIKKMQSRLSGGNVTSTESSETYTPAVKQFSAPRATSELDSDGPSSPSKGGDASKRRSVRTEEDDRLSRRRSARNEEDSDDDRRSRRSRRSGRKERDRDDEDNDDGDRERKDNDDDAGEERRRRSSQEDDDRRPRKRDSARSSERDRDRGDRERDRGERDRGDRDRGERERDRGERDRGERDREREKDRGERDRGDRDRDRERDRGDRESRRHRDDDRDSDGDRRDRDRDRRRRESDDDDAETSSPKREKERDRASRKASTRRNERRGDSSEEEEESYRKDKKGREGEGTKGSNDDSREDETRAVSPTTEQSVPASPPVNKYELDLSDMRSFLMRPTPKEAGCVQCYIERSKPTGMNKAYPEYALYLKDGDKFLMASKRRPKNKTSNYILTMQKGDYNRTGLNCLGKLRSNFIGTEFVIYDKGVNPKDLDENKESVNELAVRQELGVIAYEQNLLGKRGPRKMRCAVPKVRDDNTRMVFRPRAKDDEILSKLRDQDHTNLNFLVNKPPKWNDQVGAYVLNFSGRVTMASVKNFQLVTPDNLDRIVLQFGRVGEQLFTMDYQWPLSPMQAFAISLSSFDSKLACD